MRNYAGNCIICDRIDIGFRWSTSRYFNRQKVLDIVSKRREVYKYEKRHILTGDYKVCGYCNRKYGIMER